MNLEGVTLKLLLEESDKEKALQIYSELRPDYFTPAFGTILTHIKHYYDAYGNMPSLTELKLFKNRDPSSVSAISSIELLEVDGVDIEVALEELANQFAQNETLSLLDDLLDRITVQDRHELLEAVSSIPLKLEEKMKQSNKVYTARDIAFFSTPEETSAAQVMAGISDEWDREMGGYYKEDLILIGGRRGAGKSIVCANLIANQHKQGKPSIYFTIEMTAQETYHRIISILAQVEFSRIKKNTLTLEDKQKMGRVIASFFEGGGDVYDEFFGGSSEPDIYEFQRVVQRLPEVEEGRIIIVDDRDLSIGAIDTQLATYKSRYGGDLAMVVVDYLNQVVIDGSRDIYDWKEQIAVSKYMKNLARKHSVCMVSPYQIDEGGTARFSKGILDAADTAQVIFKDEADPEHIVFVTDKMRGGSDSGKHKVKVIWKTITIDPRAVALEEISPQEDEEVATPINREAAMDLI